ncbi:MAG: hypothetical protein CME65_05040 [Halobacteriovoraceae bacterium]|nr:hypothetical protein [Halobacteriovoraceae bacterium]|tara:strand:- start:759 stop:1103 length:345 start_codon:yes stop_codon:yes gene_type:complete
MRIALFLAVIFLNTSHASINNCQNLSKQQALKAFNLIKTTDIYEYTILDLYCEACLDSYPKPLLVESYKVMKTKNGYSVFLDGMAYNLAYLYSGGENLAQKVGCETFAVSKYLN